MLRRFLLENRGYRDFWLVLTTVLLLWALAPAGETHDALCALRVDLERRVASSEQFLREHPRGTPGIPAKFVRSSVDGQRRTIKALRGLDCSQEKP